LVAALRERGVEVILAPSAEASGAEKI